MKIFIVSATIEPEGIILLEVFEDEHESLDFEVNKAKEQILNEYGEVAANHESLSIGYSIRQLHS